MDIVEVRLGYDFLENFGGNSLVGLIAKQFGKIPNEVTLLFPRPPDEYYKQNGPYLTLTPDYAARCLIDDIVMLVTKGCKITCGEYLLDPS